MPRPPGGSVPRPPGVARARAPCGVPGLPQGGRACRGRGVPDCRPWPRLGPEAGAGLRAAALVDVVSGCTSCSGRQLRGSAGREPVRVGAGSAERRGFRGAGAVPPGVSGRCIGLICGPGGRRVLFSESLLLKQNERRPKPLQNTPGSGALDAPLEWLGDRDSNLNLPGTAICKGREDRVS